MAAAWAEWITKIILSLTDKLNRDWLRPVLFSCSAGEYAPEVRAIHHQRFLLQVPFGKGLYKAPSNAIRVFPLRGRAKNIAIRADFETWISFI